MKHTEKMSVPDIDEVPLSKDEVIARCRSLAATALIFAVTICLFYRNSGYANILQYHPICMMIAFVMVLPDVVSGMKRLKKKEKEKAASLPRNNLFRDEMILRHQLTAMAMEFSAALGFAAIEYVKITNHRPHLISPHGVVGAVCGAAIVCQMVLGSTMRYALAPGAPLYRKILLAHKLASLTIVVTGLMAMTGGLLATPYAELMFPSSAVRTAVALLADGIAVAGLVM